MQTFIIISVYMTQSHICHNLAMVICFSLLIFNYRNRDFPLLEIIVTEKGVKHFECMQQLF